MADAASRPGIFLPAFYDEPNIMEDLRPFDPDQFVEALFEG